MPAWRAFGTIAALVAAVLVAIVLHDRVFPRPLLHPANDFTTFYCSGEVVRQHADPYLVEPLRSCEQRRGEFSPSADAPWEVMPSPFPGYVLAIYALMSLLPYGAAHLAWLAVLLSGVGATIVFLRRLTGFAWLPLLAIAGVLLGFWNIDTSELTPVVSALLAYAALCARAGAWPRAGVFVALAMLIPHLTLPAFVALLLFAPAARPALLFTTAGLAALSVVTLGVGPNIEYFTRTLSTHARAEVWFPYQYSLTHLLARLGAAPDLAILAGEISYFVLIALGVWAGHRLRSVGGD
ncbi:MAG: DUF2029 domain-containing protein, partial [Candidatus Eremiobacteraeota bacterium]|nr:DUF2029 domain-containing protein [Candidatus Eremiobacteraeota bacterium]